MCYCSTRVIPKRLRAGRQGGVRSKTVRDDYLARRRNDCVRCCRRLVILHLDKRAKLKFRMTVPKIFSSTRVDSCIMAQSPGRWLALVLVQLAVLCGDTQVAHPVWIEVLSPRDQSVLYFADESARISYRTADLPQGSQVRLAINGKEALVNQATEINVDVPGLMIGQHEIEVTVIDADGAPLLAQKSRFEMRKGYSWVPRHVKVSDAAAAAMCSAADVCSFVIDARGNGSSPATAHFFRVRLVGPAIVMGTVDELHTQPGRYNVKYRAVDPGVYIMSVVLLHASRSGTADPGEGIPRQFINQHINSSPFVVRVTAAPEHQLTSPPQADTRGEDTGSGAHATGRRRAPAWAIDQANPHRGGFGLATPQPLCPGMRRYGTRGWRGRGAGPPWAQGRWVHRHLCLWNAGACEGVGSERVDESDGHDVLKDPWIWVPHGLFLSPCSPFHRVLCV